MVVDGRDCVLLCQQVIRWMLKTCALDWKGQAGQLRRPPALDDINLLLLSLLLFSPYYEYSRLP